ncbi:MAG: methyltransferase domain-containing protein [Nitrosospira sp.]|nr:methyltransferase domain-containing protein [Nitrosospira sp.]
MAYVLLALAKCKKDMNTPVSFAELFCADGYYAMAARHLGVAKSLGIDNNRDGHFTKAKLIAERLGLDNCTFVQMDVNDIENIEPLDIVANIGGLYHVENPESILEKSYALARQFLIVQTVVSLASEADDYYRSPAPGWTWGNRFSRNSFEKLIAKKGWNIIDKHFNILEGNERLEDMGSIYYLIQKDPELRY